MPGWRGGVAQTLADRAEHRAALARERHGSEAQPPEREQEREVRERVEQEHGGDVEPDDREAGQRRADEARRVERDAVDRDRGREILARHEARHEREPRRLVEADRDAAEQHQREQQRHGDQPARGQREQRDRLRHRQRLRDLDQPQAIDAVGERAAERADHHGREQIGEGDEAEHGARVAELPGEPADPDPLHPGADQRHRIAGDVDAEVAVREGPRDRAQPGQGSSSRPVRAWFGRPPTIGGEERQSAGSSIGASAKTIRPLARGPPDRTELSSGTTQQSLAAQPAVGVVDHHT